MKMSRLRFEREQNMNEEKKAAMYQFYLNGMKEDDFMKKYKLSHSQFIGLQQNFLREYEDNKELKERLDREIGKRDSNKLVEPQPGTSRIGNSNAQQSFSQATSLTSKGALNQKDYGSR